MFKNAASGAGEGWVAGCWLVGTHRGEAVDDAGPRYAVCVCDVRPVRDVVYLPSAKVWEHVFA